MTPDLDLIRLSRNLEGSFQLEFKELREVFKVMNNNVGTIPVSVRTEIIK